MTTARVTPFRAGWLGAPADPAVMAAVADTHAQAHAAGTKTLVSDGSEFQPDINDKKYLAWSRAIIIRAAYGARHDDRAWYGGQRRDLLLSGGAEFLGIYQYVTAAEDITVQAREFCRLLGGKLNKGEYPLADWEEGSGNLAGRRATWNHVVAGELGFAPGPGYSGLSFARTHGLDPVEWLAAYQGTEPGGGHLLWQFTDAFDVPGIGRADCSVYDGPLPGLVAHAFGGIPPAPPSPVPFPPPFPYPPGDWLGLESASPHGHSGFSAADQPHVATWQQQMTRRGWAVPVTGHFDAACDRACRQFQSEKNIQVDGLVGQATWTAAWTAPVT